MEDILKKFDDFIKRHEESVHTHYCGDIYERFASIINHYQRTAAHSVSERKNLIEDVLVYFRSVAMISESIGMAATHAEKSARLRGLIELINSAIKKLRKEQTDGLLNNWDFYSWDMGTYPYKAILEKYRDLEEENKRLNQELKNLKAEPEVENDNGMGF